MPRWLAEFLLHGLVALVGLVLVFGALAMLMVGSMLMGLAEG